jgi:hypothetical protein
MGMTNIRVVRYTTTPETVAENTRLVSQVFTALDEAKPDGLRYGTLLLPEQHTFLHLVITPGEESPLSGLPAFDEFQRDLSSRVVGAAHPALATLVGNFRLL